MRWAAIRVPSCYRGLNPFYYLLEVVRGPLLGEDVTIGMVAKALVVSAVIDPGIGACFCADTWPPCILECNP